MKNRRAASGGYPRGNDTRARVIASALRLFGQHGFDGASTRDIAVDAGVNAPALQYYFASKEGLYLACVEHLISRLWSYAGDAFAHAEALLVERAGDSQLIDAYCALQERLGDFLLASHESSDWLLLIVREQANLGPDCGFQLMYDEVSAKIMKVSCTVVSRLGGGAAAANETRLRAMTLNSQLFTFLFLRRTLLTALDWDKLDPARIDTIKRIVRANTEELLLGLARARKKKSIRKS